MFSKELLSEINWRLRSIKHSPWIDGNAKFIKVEFNFECNLYLLGMFRMDATKYTYKKIKINEANLHIS